MRRLVLLCALTLMIGCAKEPVPPPAPRPAVEPHPLPDPFFIHRVEQRGETLGDISRWYTGKYGNWVILIKPVNPELEQCCAKLEVGREVKIPRHLMIRTDPMPAPKKKVVSRPPKPPKETKSEEAQPPKPVGEAPAPPDESNSEEALPPPAPAEAPPPIIGPK